MVKKNKVSKKSQKKGVRKIFDGPQGHLGPSHEILPDTFSHSDTFSH